MKNLVTIIILAIAATGCGDVVETDTSSACWTSSIEYVRTDFDCGTHSVEYVICDNPGGTKRVNCVDSYDVPEVFMDHCYQSNVCEG